jgi:Raf kinase inhibitor-like YbhB/YbcL family protein
MALQVQLIDVTSPAFRNGDRIPVKYTADGDDMSPPLNWPQVSGVSEWALICEDPDAPSGTFVHWVMYNIPSGYTGLPDGITQDSELDDGSMQGKNSLGKIGYTGPSPPPGKPHHYNFKVYALDVKMDLPPGITSRELLEAMEGHVIAEGVLTGMYGR